MHRCVRYSNKIALFLNFCTISHELVSKNISHWKMLNVSRNIPAQRVEPKLQGDVREIAITFVSFQLEKSNGSLPVTRTTLYISVSRRDSISIVFVTLLPLPMLEPAAPPRPLAL